MQKSKQILQFLTIISLLIIIPLGLFCCGFTVNLALTFSICFLATVTDCILTKIGLHLGLKEQNLIYSLMKRKVNIDVFLASGIIGWFFLFLILLIVFRDSTFLLLYGMGAFFCVIANSFTVWSKVIKIVNEKDSK